MRTTLPCSSWPTRLLAVSAIALAACNGETPKPPSPTPIAPPKAAAPTMEKEGPATPGMTSTPTKPPTTPATTPAGGATAKPTNAAPTTPPAGAAAATPAGAAATPPAAAGTAALSGKLAAKVSYLERIMLPPGATVKVQLVDVSRADAPAIVINEKSLVTTGGPPYAFELTYDPAKIDPSHSYAVQARIERDGKLIYINDARHGVLTRGEPMDAVEVIVKRTGDETK